MSESIWKSSFFSLDTQDLWSHPDGPRWEPESERQLNEADRTLGLKYSSGAVGFYRSPGEWQEADFRRLEGCAEQLRAEFGGVLIFGIGGSYLGAAALQQALQTPEAQKKFPVSWLSNVDPVAVRQARTQVESAKTAAVVISKSGNTTETLAGFYHLSERLDPTGYVVVTDPQKGELRRLVGKYGWKSFDVPPSVGGRFSVLTAVGLLPALLAGISARELIQGALSMRQELESYNPSQNPAYRFAAALHRWDRDFSHSLQYLMPYWGSLKYFADWYVQLWGESLGKKTIRDGQAVGPTPVAALGTTDQHSLLQLFKEGPPNKVVGFIDVKGDPQGLPIGKPAFDTGEMGFLCRHRFEEVSSLACAATRQSLVNSRVPTYQISVPELSARALGALMFFFEVACAFAGELYGVDAFDQPGVEESKRLLRQSL